MCDNSNEDIQVEIIFPEKYVQRNLETMKQFAGAAAHYCKAAAILGQDDTSFMLVDISVLQVYSLEEAMKTYGIEMTHQIYRIEGKTCAYFYADIRELKKLLESQ